MCLYTGAGSSTWSTTRERERDNVSFIFLAFFIVVPFVIAVRCAVWFSSLILFALMSISFLVVVHIVVGLRNTSSYTIYIRCAIISSSLFRVLQEITDVYRAARNSNYIMRPIIRQHCSSPTIYVCAWHRRHIWCTVLRPRFHHSSYKQWPYQRNVRV